MSATAEVPLTRPMRLTWEKYQTTDAYRNARRWAVWENNIDGSMWAAFCVGWEMALAEKREAGGTRCLKML